MDVAKSHFPVHYYIWYDYKILYYRCVKLLCKYSTDIKLRTSERQDTALHIAACSDQLDILKLLLNEGLDPELR